MAPEKQKPRKRNRKRKRRNISSSSSSSLSSSEEGEDERPQIVMPKKQTVQVEESEESDSSSSSSSSSSSRHSTHQSPSRRAPSRSPSPPTVDIPPFLPPNPTTDAEKEREQALKDRFRKFWMGSVADEFKDDLEQIRKEPNLSPSRLFLLVDSLASGANVFSSSGQSGSGEINEMEVVLDS